MNEVGVLKYEEECREMKMILRGISHEMGNALTVMGYSIKNFGKKPVVKEDEDWNYISEDYEYICRLFKSLSAYNNSREIETTKVNLDEILESVVNSLKGEYETNKVLIKYSGLKKTYVLGDEIKLRQVFINIIKNAYEAVNTLAGEENGIIDIRLCQKEDKYLINIKDNGCGIKKENIVKIFEPMYTSGKEGGTGLGLPVCKNIIESHGGKIKVSSVIMCGTDFEIELKKIDI